MDHPDGRRVTPERDEAAPLAAVVEADAGELLAALADAGVPARLIGSLAVRLRCPGHRAVMAALGRRPARDVDLVVYQRDELAVERLLERRSYVVDPAIRHSREFGIKRLIFHDPHGRYKVDVFIDKLVMAHTVDLRGRLDLAAVTVPLTDLLLSKLQIHEITENDLIDLAVLLAEHPLDGGGPPANDSGGDDSRGDDSRFDLGRLGRVLGDDWGFHRTAHGNLEKLGASLERFVALGAAGTAAVRARADGIVRHLDGTPKSRRWRGRAIIGTRLRWYEDVEEVDRR